MKKKSFKSNITKLFIPNLISLGDHTITVTLIFKVLTGDANKPEE